MNVDIKRRCVVRSYLPFGFAFHLISFRLIVKYLSFEMDEYPHFQCDDMHQHHVDCAEFLANVNNKRLLIYIDYALDIVSFNTCRTAGYSKSYGILDLFRIIN